MLSFRYTYCTFPIFCLELVPVIADVEPSSHPLICAFCFILFHRVNEWLHSYCICRVVFLEIHDVEFVSATFGNVSNGEEVPLPISKGVVVEV